jgi:hypothetical protein
MPIGREPADRTSEGTADGIEDGTADEMEGTWNRKRNPFFK